jgi:hypothetical protein
VERDRYAVVRHIDACARGAKVADGGGEAARQRRPGSAATAAALNKKPAFAVFQ